MSTPDYELSNSPYESNAPELTTAPESRDVAVTVADTPRQAMQPPQQPSESLSSLTLPSPPPCDHIQSFVTIQLHVYDHKPAQQTGTSQGSVAADCRMSV